MSDPLGEGRWGSLRRIRGRRERGRWARAVAAKRSGQILSTEGSFIHGGRFNPPLRFGALYVSEDEEGCTAEILHQVGGRPEILEPFVVAEIAVNLARVLDLTVPAIRERLGLSLRDLTDLTAVGISRALGTAAREAGFQGIRYPSAAKPGKRNLAIFMDRVGSDAVRTLRAGPLRMG